MTPVNSKTYVVYRNELNAFLESNNFKLVRKACMVGLSCQDSDKARLRCVGQ